MCLLLKAYNNATALNGDRTRFFTIGQSAGGSLALTLVRRLINIGRNNEVKGIASIVPFFVHPKHIPGQYLDKYRSFHELEGSPVTTKDAMSRFYG